MIENFKEGYYYKFIGNLNERIYWCTNAQYEDKKKILDGKWHKCVKVQKEPYYHVNFYAKFEGMEKERCWFYGDFIESKHPPKEKIIKLLEGI